VIDLSAARDRFPCRITLAALAELCAAQQSQDGGCPWGEVLDHALDAAVQIVDLLPDAAVELARKPPE
jgi:hypothetical protein